MSLREYVEACEKGIGDLNEFISFAGAKLETLDAETKYFLLLRLAEYYTADRCELCGKKSAVFYERNTKVVFCGGCFSEVQTGQFACRRPVRLDHIQRGWAPLTPDGQLVMVEGRVSGNRLSITYR